MYKLIFKKPAKRFLKKQDKSIKIKIIKKLKFLKENPRLGKPLVGNLAGLWSLRIGKYRIIYQIKEQELIIFVLNIEHRKKVYK